MSNLFHTDINNLSSLKIYYIKVRAPRAFHTTTYLVGYRGNTAYLRQEAIQLLHFKLYRFMVGLKKYDVHICCFVDNRGPTHVTRWVASRLKGSWVLNTYRRGPWLFSIKGVCYPVENPYLLNNLIQFFEPGAVVLFGYPAGPVLSYIVQSGAPIIDLSPPSQSNRQWAKFVSYRLYQNDTRTLLFYARLLVCFFNENF